MRALLFRRGISQHCRPRRRLLQQRPLPLPPLPSALASAVRVRRRRALSAAVLSAACPSAARRRRRDDSCHCCSDSCHCSTPPWPLASGRTAGLCCGAATRAVQRPSRATTPLAALAMVGGTTRQMLAVMVLLLVVVGVVGQGQGKAQRRGMRRASAAASAATTGTAAEAVLHDPAEKAHCAHHFTADRVSTREFPAHGVCVSETVYHEYHWSLQPEGKLGFVQVPKTGSTSLKMWLQGKRMKTRPRPGTMQHAFMISRHPEKRFVSCLCTTLSRRRLAPIDHRADAQLRHRCQDQIADHVSEQLLGLGKLDPPVSTLLTRNPEEDGIGFTHKESESLVKAAKVVLYLLQHPKTEVRCGNHHGVYWDRHCWSQATFMFMRACTNSPGTTGRITAVDRAIRFEFLLNGLQALTQESLWRDAIPSIEEKPLPSNQAHEGLCLGWAHNHSFVPPAELTRMARDYYSQDMACFGYD